jgi:DNA-binding transcriptional MerR regulator
MIGEVSDLCGSSLVLRYWEQESTQLRPMKDADRRYYQYHEV